METTWSCYFCPWFGMEICSDWRKRRPETAVSGPHLPIWSTFGGIWRHNELTSGRFKLPSGRTSGHVGGKETGVARLRKGLGMGPWNRRKDGKELSAHLVSTEEGVGDGALEQKEWHDWKVSRAQAQARTGPRTRSHARTHARTRALLLLPLRSLTSFVHFFTSSSCRQAWGGGRKDLLGLPFSSLIPSSLLRPVPSRVMPAAGRTTPPVLLGSLPSFAWRQEGKGSSFRQEVRARLAIRSSYSSPPAVRHEGEKRKTPSSSSLLPPSRRRLLRRLLFFSTPPPHTYTYACPFVLQKDPPPHAWRQSEGLVCPTGSLFARLLLVLPASNISPPIPRLHVVMPAAGSHPSLYSSCSLSS